MPMNRSLPRPWLASVIGLLTTVLGTAVALGAAQSAVDRPRPPTTGAPHSLRVVRSDLTVVPTRAPTIVSVDVTGIRGGAPVLPDDAAARTIEAAARDSMILVELRGLPLRFAKLPPAAHKRMTREQYETGYSTQLAALVRSVLKAKPGIQIGVLGLPFERGEQFEASNASYGETLRAVTAMSPLGGVLASSRVAGTVVRSQFQQSFKESAGRPVIFRGGEGWELGRSSAASTTAPSGVSGASTPSDVQPSVSVSSPASAAPQSGSGMIMAMAAGPASTVGVAQVIADWGASGGMSDVNDDGEVGGKDLAFVLAESDLMGMGEVGQATGLFLVGGSGFTGPTPQPPAVGAPGSNGNTAKAIARWTIIPYQEAGDQLRVGVIAFHRNGIDKVTFSADGGPWAEATSMTINPTTGVSEFLVTLRASDFPDGKVELRAIAYPKAAGVPRVLGGAFQSAPNQAPPLLGEYSTIVWTNAGGTVSREPRYVSGQGSDESGDGTAAAPYRTLSRAAQVMQQQYGNVEGCTIYCLPGEFDFEMKWGFTAAKADERYVTITVAPGVARDQVFIEEARPKTGKIRLSNVSLKTNAAGNFYTGFNDLRTTLWIENCKVTTLNGRYGSSQAVLQTCSQFVTESLWTDAPDGPVGAILVRNCVVQVLKSDMVSGCQVVVNVQGGDIDPADTGAHPDIYQMYRPNGGMDNHIVYGLRASNFLAQGLFLAALANGEKIQNSAFVNIVLDANPSNFSSQLNRDCEHVLLVNCTLDQTFYIRTGGFDNVSFVGNIFRAVTLDLALTSPAQVATVDWRHNHFVDTTSYGTYSFGTDVTTGPAPVVNWSLGDFRPLQSGGLAERFEALYCNFDASGLSREPMTAVGALEAID
ncbi:MAG: hypothetical protein SGJ11_00975 [Phycisphaerae bacterium]|nr:hypothetical protein [Phycisphaerae bacterium]